MRLPTARLRPFSSLGRCCSAWQGALVKRPLAGRSLCELHSVCFMCAHEEQLEWIDSLNMDVRALLASGMKFRRLTTVQHITYTLIIASLAFLIYLHATLMLALWNNSGRNAPPPDPTAAAETGDKSWRNFNWKTLLNGGSSPRTKHQQRRPVEPAQNGYAVVAPDTTHGEEVDEELELDDATDAYWAQRPAEGRV